MLNAGIIIQIFVNGLTDGRCCLMVINTYKYWLENFRPSSTSLG